MRKAKARAGESARVEDAHTSRAAVCGGRGATFVACTADGRRTEQISRAGEAARVERANAVRSIPGRRSDLDGSIFLRPPVAKFAKNNHDLR